ncbi:D-2-hydroxyacid dehydrogenase [[Clostridium] polysaccharolyticum]|uniref:Glycerate dehydrogenase n=1 Tax=[Clostridium] polysaccharolyticum TaxID=29364 RepID=A0A1I0BWU0_9FIRM|nr:D-2-hydroxyacid dehydrogenase [[Clostridium] polysaccharolyticum]SET11497.1 glycerate dehydrogenase [[Clostridium] polysaccharolyticum]
MKIVFLETACLGEGINYEMFSQIGDVELYDYTPLDKLSERVADADIIVLNKIPMNESTLAGAKNLKLICITATGTNIVDFAYTNQKGITVTNVKGYSTPTVAQHTFALYFALAEQIAYYDNCVKSKAYSESEMFVHHGPVFHDLSGLTWGIVGLGDIGKKVAQVAQVFDCKVQYYSTSGKNSNADYRQVTFDELLTTSDIISIHAPLNEATQDLFSTKAFKKMKKSAIILNLGRGPIINEQALADALNAGEIAGAGLDVFTVEPLPLSSPLLEVKEKEKMILTPHIAWASAEARTRLVQEVYWNIEAFLNKEERNVVR